MSERERDPATGYYVNQWPTLSKPLDAPKLRVLSLGAGVQSSTLALMASRGDIGPMPDCAIFSDPHWESKETMAHLDWLETQLPFPVYRVTSGNLKQAILDQQEARSGRFASVPWYIRFPDGTLGMGRRQCTAHYKIEPVTKMERGLIGLAPKQRGPREPVVEEWIGISTDEPSRMKPSKQRWKVARWPLIEAGMSRPDCIEWLRLRQYPVPPGSACEGCPFQSNANWRDKRDNQPEVFAELVAMDRIIRDHGSTGAMRGQQFMHRSGVPLDVADLRDEEDGGLHSFMGECEGRCGL